MASSKHIDIINICGETSGGHCGYCGKDSDNKSSYGITCDKMKPETYLNLMNRGWRRCGSYYYKPLNDSTCCPLYPIRCNASQFKLSKSQRKVLKRMEDFLVNGKKVEKPLVNASGDSLANSQVAKKCKDLSKPDKAVNLEKDRSKKAKTIRYNLKLDKFRKMAEAQNSSFDAMVSDYKERRQRRLMSSKGRLLHEYLDFSRLTPTKHSLSVRTIRCWPSSKQFSDILAQEHKVYEKYQCAVHHDKPAEVTLSQFTRFLVEGSLSHGHSAETVDASRPCRLSQGQYHQQYWLDNDTLIAVGVIDLLPTGLSSVYLFYDPVYSFLNLGIYSALVEIDFVNKVRAQSDEDDFIYYYMGFYVHDCVKMRYKAQFAPSFIACPLTFDWTPVNVCLPILDGAKYARFAEASVTDSLSLSTKTDNQIFDMITVFLKGKQLKLSKIRSNVNQFFLVELVCLAKLMGAKALRNVQISL